MEMKPVRWRQFTHPPGSNDSTRMKNGGHAYSRPEWRSSDPPAAKWNRVGNHPFWSTVATVPLPHSSRDGMDERMQIHESGCSAWVLVFSMSGWAYFCVIAT